MTQEGTDGEARVSRGELVPAGPPDSLQDWAELLVARAREDGVALTGEGGLLTGLMRRELQTGLVHEPKRRESGDRDRDRKAYQ